MNLLKRAIQQALRQRGYEFRRIADDQSIDASNAMFRWLRGARIDTVIDIGAHDGEFLAFLQRFFNASRCYAFEPLPGARLAIESRKIPGLKLFPHALSDRAGVAMFEVNGFAPASSMLPIAPLQTAEFPQTSRILERIEVPLARLDDLLDADALGDGVFVKIDVQGMEDKVLAGGIEVIGRADYVMVEVSFRPMYLGQALFEDVHAKLAAMGFRLRGVKNQLSSASGEPLFGHFLYGSAA